MFTHYDYLAEFVIVAETGSLSEAASTLNLSQPTISKHLSVLEAKLGHKLIVRTPHGNELTEIGVAVYEAGKRLFDVGEEVVKAATKKESFVVLQLVDSLELYGRISRTTRQLETADYPDHRVRLEFERYYGNPFTALDGDIGLAIYLDSVYPQAPDRFECIELGTCSFVAFMASNNPLASQPELHMCDLRASRLSRLTGGSSLLNHIWQAIRLRCLTEGLTLESVTHKIFYPAEVPSISLAPDEVFILPSDSQSVAIMASDPSLRHVPIVDFSQSVTACYHEGDKVAEQFCEIMTSLR